jgi:hypothetical protein
MSIPPTPTPAATAMVELTRALKLLVNDDNYMDPTFDPVATAQSAITHLAHLSERVARAEEERAKLRVLCSSARDTAVCLVDAQKGPNNVMRVEGPQRLKDKLNEIMGQLPYSPARTPPGTNGRSGDE